MKKFSTPDDEGKPKDDPLHDNKYGAAADPNAPPPRKRPPIYGICIAISVVAFSLLIALLIVSQAGGSSGEKKVFPKAIVFVIPGLGGATMNDIINSQKAPTMQRMVKLGLGAKCESPSDNGCCRSPSFFSLDSDSNSKAKKDPLLVSLLTGVSPSKHQLNNASEIYHSLRKSPYPTFLRTASMLKLRVSVVGPLSSILSGTVYDAEITKCQKLGIVDAECVGVSCVQETKAESFPSCNYQSRYVYDPESFTGSGEREEDPSASFARKLVKSFDEQLTDVMFVYLSAPYNAGLEPKSGFSSKDLRFLSEVYRADALMGILYEMALDRSVIFPENWLIMAVSDSVESSSSDTAFAMSVLSKGKTVSLQPPPKKGLSTLDVVPTVLRWFGLNRPSYLEGAVRGLCGGGADLGSC